jgi:hypothetical protein
MATLEEELYLAQKIFKGETGRYAKTWPELSRIASFAFEGKDLSSFEVGPVNRRSLDSQGATRHVDSLPLSEDLVQSLARPLMQVLPLGPLEIEPIVPESPVQGSREITSVPALKFDKNAGARVK